MFTKTSYYFLTETFETKPIPYKEMFLNTERRWACGINIENKLFVHGGWNSRGPLDDMLMLNLGTIQFDFIFEYKINNISRQYCYDYFSMKSAKFEQIRHSIVKV